MEQDKNRLQFGEAFDATARTRAISILLTALLETHPDKASVLAYAEKLVNTDEAALANVVRARPEVHKGDGLYVASQHAARVREKIEAIVNGLPMA